MLDSTNINEDWEAGNIVIFTEVVKSGVNDSKILREPQVLINRSSTYLLHTNLVKSFDSRGRLNIQKTEG